MSDLIVYGFPRSAFVNVVRLVLTHKEVPYTFHDLKPEMGKPSYLARPVGRGGLRFLANPPYSASPHAYYFT
jgi:Glutathione S-transferase, N-terminal domain